MRKTEEQVFLENYDINKYERPSVATDIAVFTIMKDDENKDNYRKLPTNKLKILLIKRALEPFKDKWALPGGFLRKDETVYDSARRELKEETGTDNAFLEMCYVFSEQNRDPRGWIISQAFMALINGEECNPNPGGDAKEAKWFDVELKKINEEKVKEEEKEILSITYELVLTNDIKLSALIEERKYYNNYHEMIEYKIKKSEGLAFDHGKIITCILNRLRRKIEIDSRIVFDLMQEEFTLTDLQSTFETILDKELIKPNFRRKISEYVIETDKTVLNGGHRPSKLFKRNMNIF